jgi:pyruvate formate lyase activating enzyme
MLKSLAQKGLIDYVAMDVKSNREGYAAATGVMADMEAVEESLRFLIDGALPYELRTTLVAQLHTPERMEAMGQWLASLVPGKIPTNLYLQSFVDRDTVIFSGLTAPTENTVLHYQKLLSPFVTNVTIRNT